MGIPNLIGKGVSLINKGVNNNSKTRGVTKQTKKVKVILNGYGYTIRPFKDKVIPVLLDFDNEEYQVVYATPLNNKQELNFKKTLAVPLTEEKFKKLCPFWSIYQIGVLYEYKLTKIGDEIQAIITVPSGT
jgi:hypothetical protein